VRVVVLGAAGQLGREVVRALAGRGYSLRAVVRRPPDPPFDSPVEVRLADARDKTQVGAAISGADVVVNTIGGGTLRKNDVESSTTAIAVTAAQEVPVQRYIAISAAMVALDWKFFKYVLRPLLFRNILAEHLRVEEIVKATGLKWTIVRPPRLTNGSPKGYQASLQLPRSAFSASRADVAAFIADEIEKNSYVREAVFVASGNTRQGVLSHVSHKTSTK
jgi:uncharacterized protein YbjT (DUF2867 family)